jgi:hypothetical protein
MNPEPRLVGIRKMFSNKTMSLSVGCASVFCEAGVLAVSLVSSSGSGKTAFPGENADSSSTKLQSRGVGGRPRHRK